MSIKTNKGSKLPTANSRSAPALFVITAAALALVFLGPHWIEAVFGVDPDGGGGWTEVAISMSLAAAALTLFGWQRVEWRRRLLSK
jgi:hypothetical protein